MEVGVLGPLRVCRASAPVAVPGGKERTLLALLAARVGQVVDPEEIVDALWPTDPPRSAGRSLHVHVARLRAALADGDAAERTDLIETVGRGYRLALDPMAIDARRFARLVELGQSALADGHPGAAQDALAEALDLWRGAAYGGFEASGFAQAERRRLDALRLTAREGWWAAQIATGGAAGGIADLEAHVVEHPLRERAWALLVRAHAAVGDTAGALGAWQRARDTLAEELGVDPGEELRTLHGQLLADDPTLRPRPGLPAGLAGTGSPLVGRDAPLSTLLGLWAQVESGGPGRRAVVVGPAGSGRWRLVRELAQTVHAQGGTVLLGDGAGRGRTLRVLDCRGSSEEPALPGAAELLVVVVDAPVPPGDPGVVVWLGSLSESDTRAVLAGYARGRIPGDELAQGAKAISEGTGGRLDQVERESLEWVRARLAGRVAARAERGSGVASVLAEERDELARDVELWTDLAPGAREGVAGICPWRGLASYDVDDGPWFAGRERLTAELVARIGVDRIVLLVGPSGSGKSSLLRAGLLAALAEGALPGSAGWVQVVLRPGEHPMRELTRAALSAASATGPDHVADLLARAVAGTGGAGRIVVVVDQLEEAWTVCADPGERAAFLDALADVAASVEAVSLVLAVRADLAGSLPEHPRLADAVAGRTLFVGPMGEAELRRAIEGPAAAAGLALDVGLADALVSDTLAEPGGLPLLSTALAALWEQRHGARLRLADYVAGGGVGAAVARLAEDAHADLDQPHQQACRVLFGRLAGPGSGDSVVRRRVALAELTALPDPHVAGCVDPLAQARLLTVAGEHVEVAHEALFRSWPRLRGWLAEDTAERDVRGRLTAAASEWVAEDRDPGLLWAGARLSAASDLVAHRPEELTGDEVAFVAASTAHLDAQRAEAEQRARVAARQNRRLRGMLAGVAGLLVVALVAGLVAVSARNEAQEQRVSAGAQRLAATALTEDYLADRMLTAVEAVRTEESPATRGALLSALDGVGAIVDRIDTPNRLLYADHVPGQPRGYALSNIEQVIAFDMTTGADEVLWEQEGANLHLPRLSPDGALLAFVDAPWRQDRPPALRVIDTSTGAQVLSRDLTEEPGDWPLVVAEFTGRGDELALLLVDGRVLLVDARTGRSTRPAVTVPEVAGQDIGMLALPEDRLLLMAGTAGLPARVLDLATGDTARVSGVGVVGAVSPDGRHVASQGGDHTDQAVLVADIRDPEGTAVRVDYPTRMRTAAFTPDSRTLLVGGEDGLLYVVDPSTGVVRETLQGHNGTIMGITVSPDGRTAWTAGRDGDLIAWDLDGSRRLPRRSAAQVGALWGQQSADGRRAVVWIPGSDSTPTQLAAVDLESDDVLVAPFPLAGPANLVALAGGLTPDGRTLIAGLAEAQPDAGPATLRLVDVDTGRSLAERELPWVPTGVGLSPDGTRALVNGETGVELIDTASGIPAAAREFPMSRRNWDDPPAPAVYSPDGGRIAVQRHESVEILDATTLETLTSWSTGRYDRAMALAWLDGQTVAHAGVLGRLAVRDVATGELVGDPRQLSPGYVTALAVSPDGSLLASLGTDGEVQLLDAATRTPIGSPLQPDALLWGWVRFTPDGSAVEVWYDDGSLAHYPIDSQSLIARACAIASREPSAAEWVALHGPDVVQRPTCGDHADRTLLAAPAAGQK